MARIRSIKPGFCTSASIARLSLTAELHFAKLWTYADDYGRGIDNARAIEGALWCQRDEIDRHRVDDLQAELAAKGRIVRYEIDGKRYFQVVNWHEHQKPQHPKDSEYPSPDEASGGPSVSAEKRQEDPPDHGSDFSKPHAVVELSGVVDVDGEVGGGTSGRSAARKRATPMPNPWDTTDEMIAWASSVAPLVNWRRETEQFLDHHRARGSTFKNWQAAWRTWIRNAERWRPQARPGHENISPEAAQVLTDFRARQAAKA